MTVNPKLAQVLGLLIKNDEERAKELLHEVFIEKARAIHEEMMGHDEDMEEVGGTGDMSKDFTNEVTGHHEDDMEEEITALEDEIDFEETMSEDDAMEAAKAFGVGEMALPFSAFVDSRGRVLTVHLGELHEADLRATLEVLLRADAGELTPAQAQLALKALATKANDPAASPQ